MRSRDLGVFPLRKIHSNDRKGSNEGSNEMLSQETLFELFSLTKKGGYFTMIYTLQPLNRSYNFATVYCCLKLLIIIVDIL